MNLNITPAERDLIIMGLNGRVCWIETGEFHIRAADAINSGQRELIKPLNSDQMRLIVATEDLVHRLYQLK